MPQRFTSLDPAADRIPSLEIVAVQRVFIDPLESRFSKNLYNWLLRAKEMQPGDVTYSVCIQALHEAYRELEDARGRRCEAAHALATIRESLDQRLDLAYQQQSFSPLNNLFDEEEAALAIYEQAVARVGEAEGRWSALSVALAYEKQRMMAAQLPRSRMN